MHNSLVQSMSKVFTMVSCQSTILTVTKTPSKNPCIPSLFQIVFTFCIKFDCFPELTCAFVDRVSNGYAMPTPIAPPTLPANRLDIVAAADRFRRVELLASPPPRIDIAGFGCGLDLQ